MLRLVEEYGQKPGLVPPLVILEDLNKLSIYPCNIKICEEIWPETWTSAISGNPGGSVQTCMGIYLSIKF